MCYIPIKSHKGLYCQDVGHVFVCLLEFSGGFGVFLSVLQVHMSVLAGQGVQMLY